MSKRYPVLYVPTKEIRRAVADILAKHDLYLSKIPELSKDFSQWEITWGTTVHHIKYRKKNDWVFVTKEELDNNPDKFIMTNSIDHFISIIKNYHNE